MGLVTLSATYGAGGSWIGPELARRLDVPFVDRLISSDTASHMSVPLDAACRADDVTRSRVISRLLASLAPIGEAYGVGGTGSHTHSKVSVADAAEQAIFERADSGSGVILGRAAALVLGDDPRALHVRLDGPREARLGQAMRIEGIDREAAAQRMKATDDARHGYVRHFRHADARDPALYHLIIDSTVVELNCCVDIIALATGSRTAVRARGAIDPSEVPT